MLKYLAIPYTPLPASIPSIISASSPPKGVCFRDCSPAISLRNIPTQYIKSEGIMTNRILDLLNSILYNFIIQNTTIGMDF